MRLTWLIERAARQAGSRPALTFQGRSLTWTETLERCARFAAALQALGVNRGDRVAYLALNSLDYFVAFFASAWAGAILVPLNTRHAEAELAEIIDDCTAVTLIVDDAFAEAGSRLSAECPTVRHLILEGVSEGRIAAPHLLLDALIDTAQPGEAVDGPADEVGYLFYTSGTTGQPKGVMLTHANYYMNSLGVLLAYRTGELRRGLYPGPYFHVATSQRVFASATAAAHTVILPRFEAGAVLHAIEEHRIEAMSLVPTMIGMMLDHTDIDTVDLSSLRTIGYGASPITETLLRRAMDRLPHVEFRQGYGMTEAAPLITVLGAEEHRDIDAAPHRLRSAGKTLPYVEVRIIDEDDGDLKQGEIGEVAVRGPNIMKGYWNRPEDTEKALRGGWFHTGDAGYLDEDGYLYLVDRVKDMIVSGGENVYSVEVENALEKHPAVAQSAVIGVPHEKWVEAVHAVIVLKAGATASTDELIAFCHERIANYKCPRSVSFREGPLPLSGSNKVLKTKLREEHARAQGGGT